MARVGEPIELIIAETLWPTPIRQTGPVADGVVAIIGLVDLAAGGGELMQDIRHLTGGIVRQALCGFVEGTRRSPIEYTITWLISTRTLVYLSDLLPTSLHLYKRSTHILSCSLLSQQSEHPATTRAVHCLGR